MTLAARRYSNGAIGERLNLSKFIVKNHVSETRSKLNVMPGTRLAAIASQYQSLTEGQYVRNVSVIHQFVTSAKELHVAVLLHFIIRFL